MYSTIIIGHDARGTPMKRKWLGPWILVGDKWYREALDFSYWETLGERRWVYGPIIE